MRSRALLPLFLLALPIRADGLEVAVGVAMGPTLRGAAPGSTGDNLTAGLVRVGWDASRSETRMGQWQALAQRGATWDLRQDAAGAGWQHSWWTWDHELMGALGADLRLERFAGKDSLAAGPSPLGGASVWMLRPWVRAQAGFRGILLPFLPAPGGDFLAFLTQGGAYTHPFTRLEVAAPLWRQGGEGELGVLRQMAPRFEVSVQFGMRFGQGRP